MDNIIASVKKGLRGFEVGGFHTGSIFEDYPYYEYFDAKDKEIRRYAIAVYMVKLGNWEAGCVFHFYKKPEELCLYTQAFLKNRDKIRREFPSMYHRILELFQQLLKLCKCKKEHWELVLPDSVESDMKREIYNYLDKTKMYFHMKYLLKELNIQPFYKSDFLD
ncbi:hypothetical protein ACQKNX_05095 [Lysinibacillus sp. NPDC093712]|uniref:hypothetical protein n=1 Tax=Lysinibacillus sp. NPDC093712 TaxID=3390579 RepID=UPI003CFE04E3